MASVVRYLRSPGSKGGRFDHFVSGFAISFTGISHRWPPWFVHSPWNYPVVLSLSPLVGAIAAGCPAVIKPSEVSANVTDVLAQLLPKYLDPNAYVVVKGAVPETTYLLSLKWDFILFTGNSVVGKIIASAAAKNITPCALELGGASPVVLADDADISLAAKRILWG